jgi:hypothetical protein
MLGERFLKNEFQILSIKSMQFTDRKAISKQFKGVLNLSYVGDIRKK